MRWWIILCVIYLHNVFADNEEKTRLVILDDGPVVATKYWDGDYYEFLGIPYAEAPTGRDRYQAPLPVKPWKDVLTADVKTIVCHQSYYTNQEGDNDEFIVTGDDDCLLISLFVPEIASEDNLVPVVVYIHSGAYAGGNSHMARYHYLARHDIIVISFNYRLGALGFVCLGNKEIPGNAGLKDQLAALRWIKKNVKKFGGDPNKVTLAGFSVGASMAELLTLSKTTDGLIDQLILDSGSGLTPFAINRDPINTAKNLAFAMGYNGTADLQGLTEFYLNASVEILAVKSLNFFLPNSTFGFAPCIENFHRGIEPFLTESPMTILRKGKNKEIPVLIGFANMEGISRTIKFGEWREQMTKDFSNFLPADLIFDDDERKEIVIKKIRKRYFNLEEVNHEKLQNYIDYFSDAMFKYSIVKSLRLRSAVSKRKIYFYEFSYVGKLNMQHNYMDRIKGASHRDQTAYTLDFFAFANNYKDLDMRDRMTTMWTDFVKYGNPTAYESPVINYKWLPYTNENQNYLHISRRPTMKKNLFVEGFNFWNKIYEKYYWDPTAPEQPKKTKKKETGSNQSPKNKNKSDAEGKQSKESKVLDEKEKETNKDKATEEGNKSKDNVQKIINNENKVKQNKEESNKNTKENLNENNVVKEIEKEEVKANNDKKEVKPKKENNDFKQNNGKKEIADDVKKEQIKVESNPNKDKEKYIEKEIKKENNKVDKEKKVKDKGIADEVKKEQIKVGTIPNKDNTLKKETVKITK